jgi:CRISPR-associated protein Cas4
VKDVIEDAFNKALNVEPLNMVGVVYVTELVGCLRRSWYRRKHSYRTTKEMICGTAVHREVLERVAAEVPVAYAEVEKRVEYDVRVMGRDILLVGKVDLYVADGDLETFVEYKTSEWVFEEHVEQGNIYAVLLDVNRFYICYMPKSDTVKCREFERTWTVEDVMQRLETFINHLVNNTEPPRREGTWCSYCEFKALCRRNKTLV